jgi:hypothetical protein
VRQRRHGIGNGDRECSVTKTSAKNNPPLGCVAGFSFAAPSGFAVSAGGGAYESVETLDSMHRHAMC